MSGANKHAAHRSLRDLATLSEFVRNLREGVYITAPDGEILDANPAFLEMFGVNSLADIRNYRAEQLLVDPQRRAEELCILDRDGAVRDFELEIRRPDGRTRTVVDTCYKVVDRETNLVVYHGILIDITERKALEEQLRRMAIRDALTGCYNRYFLRQVQTQPDWGAVGWGVIIVDVDHFKDYNDRQGHDKGDKILVEVGRFLMRQVRPEDAVIRTGGDEFVLLLLGVKRDVMARLADQIRGATPRRPPVSLSVGWAVREGDEPLEETIRRADRRLIQMRLTERTSAGSGPTEADG